MRPTLSDSAATAVAALAGRRCVVLGGLGFIGSNTALALEEAGAEVTVIDSLEPRQGGNRRNLEGAEAEVVIADIGDRAAARGPLAEAEYVFNLAGQVSHIDSMDDPLRDLDINARSQLAFLEILRETRAKPRVVFASTRQIYGRPRELPVAEDHPIEPVDINGVSKFAADRFHLLYHRVHGIPTTVLRFSNVYGPRQLLEGDHQGFLPVFCRRALDGEPITIYGEGGQRRDCLFVDDAVSALVLAATRDEAIGEVFNIGREDDLSLNEIARIVIAAAGSGEVETVPWPADREQIAIASYRTDHSKATEMIGWEPKLGLEEGLEQTFEFLRAQLTSRP